MSHLSPATAAVSLLFSVLTNVFCDVVSVFLCCCYRFSMLFTFFRAAVRLLVHSLNMIHDSVYDRFVHMIIDCMS